MKRERYHCAMPSPRGLILFILALMLDFYFFLSFTLIGSSRIEIETVLVETRSIIYQVEQLSLTFEVEILYS